MIRPKYRSKLRVEDMFHFVSADNDLNLKPFHPRRFLLTEFRRAPWTIYGELPATPASHDLEHPPSNLLAFEANLHSF